MENPLYHGVELPRISREVQAGRQVLVKEAIIGKEIVEAEMARIIRHVVGATVAEMTQYITKIETGHSDFTDAHFQKGGKRTKNTLPPLLHAKPGSRTEIPAFHDATPDEHLRVCLVDDVEARGALQVAINHPDLWRATKRQQVSFMHKT